jgi:hypothetical protein
MLENLKNLVSRVYMQLLLGIYFTKMENNNMMIKQTPLVSEITVT